MPIDLTESAEEAAQFEAMMSGAPMPEPAAPEPATAPQPSAEAPPEAEKPGAPAAPEAAKTAEPERPVRLVPHQALHEERELRKAAQRELEAERAKSRQPTPQADADIDETQDPIGALAKLKAEMRAMREQAEEGRQQEAALNELGQKIGARIKTYAAEHPEYGEQCQYLRESRFNELKQIYPNRPDDALAKQVIMEEVALGQQAINDDLDPGAMIANLAKHRGWKAKEAPPAPAAKAEPKPDPEAEKKLDRLAKGLKASVSPSNAGGSGPEPESSLEDILKLDGAAFDAVWKSGKVKKLMGG